MISELIEVLGLKPVDERGWLACADPSYEYVNTTFGGCTAATALRAVLLSSRATA
jgi:hypothetical protein